MQITQSLGIRILLLITGGLTQCLALKQISVVQGHTLILSCPLKNNINMRDAVEWRNPEDLLLFFNNHKVLKDKRHKFVTLTDSEFSIRVTNITFKDGGVYTCLRYNRQLSKKRYRVIVVGVPKLEKDEQEDTTMIKCSASANNHPPRLSWVMDNGLEIEAHPYYEVKNTSNKYTAVSLLNVKVPKKRVTVKCVVRHSALHGSQLENFIHLGKKDQDTSTSWKYSSTTLGSTDTTVIPTLFSSTSFTDSHSESETTTYSNTTAVNETTEGTSSNGSTDILSNVTVNETTDSISETTEGINATSNSSNNTTGSDNSHVETRRSKKGNSTLLVLLVTCLIICLFIVLAFFLVRLRKAHISWKKENEESDQSVESSKSKSSSEEKQKQRRQGFWNTSFTKYKADETQENEAPEATPAASVQVINENPQHFISRSGIKETEL